MHVLSPQICRRDLLQTTHISFRYSSYDRRHDMYMWKCNHHQITFTLAETWLIVLFFSLTLQVEFDWIVKFSLQFLEQLQNTRPLIYMSLNKDSVYCVMPRSSKPPDTCKWGGPKWPGILELRPIFFLDILYTVLRCARQCVLQYTASPCISAKSTVCLIKSRVLFLEKKHAYMGVPLRPTCKKILF